MEIVDLQTQPCAPDVIARAGDRIAFAFNATDYHPPIQINTVAWIRGTPQDSIGVETISLPEVFALLGQDPPDTATEAPRPNAPTALLPTMLLLMVSAFVGLLGGWRIDRGGKTSRPRRLG